ncbi:hypothetical protein EGW08_014281 [Elysia chlorotica]|uniref:Uncharacterized protein n=1 Tax=Elysia chlorotica TaxID=188477 RepID=A0A433T8Q8_ELYCH|nr:hypothetical protein EGW08_014281 [Elysia chlorotica]
MACSLLGCLAPCVAQCFARCLGNAAMKSVSQICKCIPQFSPKTEDLIIFEFGWQKTYLVWRCCCFCFVAALVFTLPSVFSFPMNFITDLKYMHGWLVVMYMLGLGFESITLAYIFLCYPSWQYEKPKLPCGLCLVWNMYCITYCNIFSCAFMYGTMFSDLNFDVLQKKALLYVITTYSVVHVLTTATPSHPCHGVKPLIFNIVFLVFSYVWQMDINIESIPLLPKERGALYYAMDWRDGAVASIRALMWVLSTAISHCVMVLIASGRKELFYKTRSTKASKAQSSTLPTQLQDAD